MAIIYCISWKNAIWLDVNGKFDLEKKNNDDGKIKS